MLFIHINQVFTTNNLFTIKVYFRNCMIINYVLKKSVAMSIPGIVSHKYTLNDQVFGSVVFSFVG